MPNLWIEHVKKYAKENGMNFNQALKEASSTFKNSKKIVGKGLKAEIFQKLLEASCSFSLFAFRLVLPEQNLETRPVDMRSSCPFESFGRSSDT
jgi:hypothetical protein